MRIGVSYYPEHWEPERWARDIALMQEAGISRVRMGEFSWDRCEPEEGVYRFEWLEAAVSLFYQAGIETILCTPTPTYPAWLKDKYPGLHQVRSDGRVKHWGQRQDACRHHPGYRAAALNMADKISAYFRGHPAVTAWQIDNELGCHGTHHCWCGHCREAFGGWLERRFDGDIGRLNKAWGTQFWSQTYRRFDQIELPADTVDCRATEGQNPGLSLDFYRFSSETQIDFLKEQAAILRRNAPGIPLTHNFMGNFTGIDYFKMAEALDVVSWDNYPFFELQGNRAPMSSDFHDLNRSFKKKNCWVMEQAANGGGWTRFHPAVEPGQMRLWAWQSVARGADFLCFFRWRTSRWGAEQYWHGILDHHGVPGRRFRELKRLGEEFPLLREELEGSSVRADAAILYDYHSLWALEIQPHVLGGSPLSYAALVQRWVKALGILGITCDMVSPEENFSSYPLLIAPSQHVCSAPLLEKLKEYTARGGTLIAGLRSGVKDVHNAVTDQILPGTVLSEVLGLEVEEYDAFGSALSAPVAVEGPDGRVWQASCLADLIVPGEDTAILMTYKGRYYTGRPAVTRHAYGTGTALYAGTLLEPEGLAEILAPLLEEKGRDLFRQENFLELCAREKEGRTYRFYLNHGGEAREITLRGSGINLIKGEKVRGKILLEPFGVAVVREDLPKA